MNYKKITEGLTFLTNDKRIIIVHGVLKSLGVNRYRNDYDDLAQEAALIFAYAYATYPSDVTDPANERELMCFAYQRMRWRLLDILRRGQFEQELFSCSLDNDEQQDAYQECLIDRQSANPFANFEQADFLGFLYQHCKKNQQDYLIAKLNHHLTDKEIALTHGVSRQAVHQWKAGVINRAHQLRAKMKGKF